VVGARAVVLASLILTTGSVAFTLLVLPRQPSELRAPPLLTLPPAVGLWAAFALVTVAPARLYLQARGLVDVGDPAWPMAANVLGTTWGRAWGVQLAGAAMALTGFRFTRHGKRSGRPLALAGTLALIGAAPFMGHAAGSDRLLWLSVANDALHVAVVGAWVGTLCVLAAAAGMLRRATRGGEAISSLVTAFHPLALRSSGLVIASGVVGLLLRVPHLSSLLGSPYGNVFLVKACAVAGVAGFGAYHARAGARRAAGGRPIAVARSLAGEATLAVLTILVTAVLVGTDPPDPM